MKFEIREKIDIKYILELIKVSYTLIELLNIIIIIQ